MAACVNCGKENAPGLKFCTSCGKPFLSQPPVPPAGVAGRTCPACGASAPLPLKFCVRCGAPLGAPVQPPAEASPPVSAPLAPPPRLQPPVLPAVEPVAAPGVPLAPPLTMLSGLPPQPRRSPAGKIVAALAVVAALVGGGYYGYAKWRATRAAPGPAAVVPAPPGTGQSTAGTTGSRPNPPRPAEPAPSTAKVVGTPVITKMVPSQAAGSCPSTPPPGTTTFLSTDQARINLWISLTGLSNGDKISFALTDPTGRVNHAYDNSMDVAFDGGYLGITERDVTSDRARELHLPAQSGEELVRVYKDTAADKAGLRAGDIVLDYNGQPVEGKNQLASLIRATPPGREARLGIWRGGSTHTVIVDIRQRTKGGKVFCYHPLNPATAMPGNWSVSVYWNNQPTPVFPPLAFTVVRARP